MDALDLDVFEIRPVGRLITEAMGQIVEFEPHAVVGVLLERHAANFLRHDFSPPTSSHLYRFAVRLYRMMVTHGVAWRKRGDLIAPTTRTLRSSGPTTYAAALVRCPSTASLVASRRLAICVS